MTTDQMTGNDLVMQENYEEQFDRDYFNNLDRVDRRDKRGEITSFPVTDKYRRGYDFINWSKL